ncbi:hypothetical protein L1987_49940 [Smallanthus sonchifolius]|uniref:Uncharacterized protein n=1 Tax=Smallanthus sonchifolius TaxID=185202 RepID=A0ACB9FVW4_9ASTR|nr:hypothetical protein L1987_49940 [Smallanthus sonchifolius]
MAYNSTALKRWNGNGNFDCNLQWTNLSILSTKEAILNMIRVGSHTLQNLQITWRTKQDLQLSNGSLLQTNVKVIFLFMSAVDDVYSNAKSLKEVKPEA